MFTSLSKAQPVEFMITEGESFALSGRKENRPVGDGRVFQVGSAKPSFIYSYRNIFTSQEKYNSYFTSLALPL
ncbi:MAG: hypothetical protein KKD18_00505 [Nanoarchaeota archaeon]|nr:hypothetical protein [Nanoarchaeota archaeon]